MKKLLLILLCLPMIGFGQIMNGKCISGDCENGYGIYEALNYGIDRYEGWWKDGKCHGKGTFNSGIGISYVGEWKDGNYHGKGTYSYTIDGGQSRHKIAKEWAKLKYVGGKDGILDGITITYIGEFKDGEYDGKGKLTENYGYSYTGDFKNGKYHGKGTEICCEVGVVEAITLNGFWEEGEFIGEKIKQ